MWFKQAKVFHFPNAKTYNANKIEKNLSNMAFQKCLPSLPVGYGWISPVDVEYSPLSFTEGSYTLICMHLQEKILPSTVVTQELNDKILQIKKTTGRKVYKKEKQQLKDEVISNLLPKAFSKFTKVYAFIDKENDLLIINTITKSKLDKFISLLKKTFGDNVYHEIETKKIDSILTRWLINDSCPSSFAIEQSCIMNDPNQQSRVISCQHQDLTFKGIQQLLQDGYSINQLSLNWKDEITFVLTNNFEIKTIKYGDDIIELSKDNYDESPEHKFHADFQIMTKTLSNLINKLIKQFAKQ